MAMKTELMNLNNIPDEAELTSLLGKNIYMLYHELCKVITSQLSPDLEIWDRAGRRGKYFHGYRITKQSMLVDLFLHSVNKQGYITCEFHFIKRYFSKIVKQKELFGKQIQKNIDYSVKFNEEHGGGYYLDVIIKNLPYPN